MRTADAAGVGAVTVLRTTPAVRAKDHPGREMRGRAKTRPTAVPASALPTCASVATAAAASGKPPGSNRVGTRPPSTARGRSRSTAVATTATVTIPGPPAEATVTERWAGSSASATISASQADAG